MPSQSPQASGGLWKMGAIGVVIGGALVQLTRPASAWSTFYYAKPTTVAVNHRNRRSHYLVSNAPSSSSSWILHALPDDDYGEMIDNGGSSGNGGNDGGEQRRRKRDILKRTLGLGGSTPSSAGGGEEQQQPVMKLNTDNLFKGMPGMDSILGTTPAAPLLPDVVPSDFSSEPPIQNNVVDENVFQTQGQKKDPDLLTPVDIAALNSKYDTLKSQSEELISNELSKGSSGELFSSEDNITAEEAKRIVDYAVEEEKMTETRDWNAMKKRDMVAGWENEGRLQERRIDDDLSSSQDGGQDILSRDGVASEILSNAANRESQTKDEENQKEQLNFYQRQMMQRNEIEGVVDKATAELGDDADIDDVYEEALNQIQSSRRTKLGPKTLGVLANSIALEEGREYVRNQKVEKEFLRNVEVEANLVDASDEEVASFFRAPVNFNEERMYRSIVRQIVGKRADAELDTAAERIDDADGDDKDEDGEAVDYYAMPYQDAKTKYTLSAKETVEAYKLLNLWREMHSQQDAMEKALGMKEDTDSDNISTRRPLNKVEPFFLYQEDSPEKRAKEKENLTKVLKKGLESDDAVENSSNELLLTELLSDEGNGGITKDRAIRLLDKLLKKATDVTIVSSLKEMKKVILEEEDVIQVEEQSRFGKKQKMKKSGPIDLSGVFRTSDMEEEEEPKAVTFSSVKPSEAATGNGGARTMPSWVGDEQRETSPSMPSTPFSSSSTAEEEESVEDKVLPPPNTAFFQSKTEDNVEEVSTDGAPTGGMFGTYEEQRLQKLASKVGAQTDEEVAELRRNMEAIKEAEEMANAQLNDDEFDIAAASAKLGIDVNSINFDDDSDDQIMSVIGKRPVAGEQRKAILEFNEDESDDIIVDATGHLKKMEEVDKKIDIVDDIFRAKTAGRYTDTETRDADEAAFREFVKMEEEADKKFDSTSNENLPAGEIDIDEYADDIMSEIKPRPQIRGRREDFMSQEDVQRERKQESIFGDDDPFPVNKGGQQTASSSSGDGGSMPEWFRKEQEDLGIKVEDLTEDDFDEARQEWEREERQRKADEYLEKRGEGISISDVLGREYFGPMDEPDDNYERTESTFDSYQARKELLLGYNELTVEDINNVVDFKTDPLSTGYNPYLSRVQRPFSEYGAIFRLEGFLVDMIGIHAKVWKQVAEKYGYQMQSADDVKQASLYKPEDAVREVFFWTDDIFDLRDIVETHHAAFQEAFNDWLESDGNVAFASDDREQVSSSGENNDSTSAVGGPKDTPSDEEMDSMYFLAWSKLANNLDKTAPTNDQVKQGIAGRDWEVAVKDIFGWSDDLNEVYDIVVAYDKILQSDYKVILHKYGIDVDELDAKEKETLFGLNFPNLSLREGVGGWLDILREVEMPCAIVSHLDSSQLDVILNATGLAEYFPPDRRVSSNSGYESERSELLGAALRVEQRPDQCIVFDNTPSSANEAHEVDMKSVSFVDHYPRYELLTSDLSVGYVGDLDLSSLVKLFDKREDLEPLLELDVSSGLQKQQRKVQTAFWDE